MLFIVGFILGFIVGLNFLVCLVLGIAASRDNSKRDIPKEEWKQEYY